MVKRITTLWLSFLVVTASGVRCRSPGEEDLGTSEQCLKNCAQCKQMFGDFFEGRRCAGSCFQQSTGRVILPDCNVPASVEKYLRSLLDLSKQQQQYYQYHVHSHDSIMKRMGIKKEDNKEKRWSYVNYS